MYLSPAMCKPVLWTFFTSLLSAKALWISAISLGLICSRHVVSKLRQLRLRVDNRAWVLGPDGLIRLERLTSKPAEPDHLPPPWMPKMAALSIFWVPTRLGLGQQGRRGMDRRQAPLVNVVCAGDWSARCFSALNIGCLSYLARTSCRLTREVCRALIDCEVRRGPPRCLSWRDDEGSGAWIEDGQM